MKLADFASSVVHGIRASEIQRQGVSSDQCNKTQHEGVHKRFKDTDSSGCGCG